MRKQQARNEEEKTKEVLIRAAGKSIRRAVTKARTGGAARFLRDAGYKTNFKKRTRQLSGGDKEKEAQRRNTKQHPFCELFHLKHRIRT